MKPLPSRCYKGTSLRGILRESKRESPFKSKLPLVKALFALSATFVFGGRFSILNQRKILYQIPVTKLFKSPLSTIPPVNRNTFHPITTAVLYFSQSDSKCFPRVCAPPVHTPPSISTAIFLSGYAKSNLHLLGGAKRYSLTGFSPGSSSRRRPARSSRWDGRR